MATATIYRIYVYDAPNIRETGSHWSLTPWGGDTRDYTGEDDGGAVYELPQGFAVSGGDRPAIVDKEGYPCYIKDKCTQDLVSFGNYDTPHIIDGQGKTYTLRKAEEG